VTRYGAIGASALTSSIFRRNELSKDGTTASRQTSATTIAWVAAMNLHQPRYFSLPCLHTVHSQSPQT